MNPFEFIYPVIRMRPAKYIFPDASGCSTFVNKNKSYESFGTDV
jgi:hypothetical protein